MVGAVGSISVGTFEQPGQHGPPGQTNGEKTNSREEKTARTLPGPRIADPKGEDVPMFETDNYQSVNGSLEALQAENADLLERIAKLEALTSASTKKENDHAEQDQEFARLLEEKTDVIRELHLKIQELQASSASQNHQPPADIHQEADLVALNEELERERIQLREDEEALMHQMRALEVQMSRERAELARQRADIERLHIQVQHEIEAANKEAAMRERLLPLMRQNQTILRHGSASPQRAAKEPESQPTHTPGATNSGLFRRLFGAG
jgi:hypothetical protein